MAQTVSISTKSLLCIKKYETVRKVSISAERLKKVALYLKI